MSDSGQHSSEGAFGAPPGAGQWSQPEFPPPSGPPASYPPPTGQPYGLQPTPTPQPAPQTPPPAYPNAPAYAPQPGQPGQPVYAPAYQPGYPAYQQYQPGQPAYAGYAPTSTARFPVGTFILLILSAVSLIATGIIGIPSAIVAVVAWRRSATDPASAKRLSTTGWIVYAINFAIGVPLLIWFYVWALSNQ